MRLQAQELSVRKGRVVERAPSNFTLSSTNSANGGRPNAIRDGGIQEVAVQPVGLQPPPRLTPFLSMLTVKAEPVYPRAVEAVTEVLAVRCLDRIGKGLEHCRVWPEQTTCPLVRMR